MRVQVVARTSKLTYVWRGTSHLPKLLQHLVKDGDLGAFPLVPAKTVSNSCNSYTDSEQPARLLCSSYVELSVYTVSAVRHQTSRQAGRLQLGWFVVSKVRVQMDAAARGARQMADQGPPAPAQRSQTARH